MTPEEFTEGLPRLTENPLPIKPPFVFNGMSARVFPLRAQLDTLQRVCDGYLNFVPPEVGYFRAPLPYVYMMILDYGQVAEAVARIGWFAQIEVFFMVPVEWYRRVNGQWIFQDWAVITPYVFVDDEFSVPLGRTVYGFPKVLSKVMLSKSQWIGNATGPVTLAQIETAIFPETYSGAQIENRLFLEVERDTISNLRMPFDAASPVMPWSIASQLAEAAAGFTRDATWLAQAMRMSPVNPGADPQVLPQMLAKMMPWFAPGGSGFVQNSLNLKQFRRSNQPDQFCYQALTNGCMETKAFNGGGLLGEYSVLLGDLSGGHTVRLYEYPSLPIVKTLGLEPHRQWRGADSTVTELKPVVPFWIDVDIRYDQGETLAWRVEGRDWKNNAGETLPAQPKSTDNADAPIFNSTVTTVIDDIAGPFEFSDTTIRVLPLLARKSKLEAFLHEYINEPLEDPIVRQDGLEAGKVPAPGAAPKPVRLRFKVWSRDEGAAGDLAYVYLAISSFGSVTSMTNNVGDWAKYQMSFMIPVQMERAEEGGEWQLAGVGVVPAVSFVDNCIAAIARMEVQGFSATAANFQMPSNVWMTDQPDIRNPHQTLLRVDTEVWPAIGEGQKATVLPVVEICRGDPDAGLGSAPDAAWQWAEQLRAELLAKKNIKANCPWQLKTGRALSLELLGNDMPFTAYSLKQFRDATDPEKACYQSLVKVPRQIRQLNDLREIEETLVVTIHNYPSLDIASKLGLVANMLPVSGSGIEATAQAVRPFYIRGTLFEPLAQRLAYRAGSRNWTLDGEVAFTTLLSEEPGAPPITTDFEAEALQDEIDPCRIDALMVRTAKRQKARSDAGEAATLSKQKAREALRSIDPQTVIECVLSREWGNMDPQARWRKGRLALEQALAALPLTGDLSAFAESVLNRQLNNQLAGAPGAVASPLPAKQAYHLTYKDLKKAIKALEEPDDGEPTTAAERWKKTMKEAILIQQHSATLRIELDDAVSRLAAATILNSQEIAKAYGQLNKKPPQKEELAASCLAIIMWLGEIADLRDEEGALDDLNPGETANQARLKELIKSIHTAFHTDNVQPIDTYEMLAKLMVDHTGEYRQAVDLARKICEAQDQTFLNKLARAYQKPDFCIRRDALGAAANQLLPESLSWDKNWYYGRPVSYERKARPALKRDASPDGK